MQSKIRVGLVNRHLPVLQLLQHASDHSRCSKMILATPSRLPRNIRISIEILVHQETHRLRDHIMDALQIVIIPNHRHVQGCQHSHQRVVWNARGLHQEIDHKMNERVDRVDIHLQLLDASIDELGASNFVTVNFKMAKCGISTTAWIHHIRGNTEHVDENNLRLIESDHPENHCGGSCRDKVSMDNDFT